MKDVIVHPKPERLSVQFWSQALCRENLTHLSILAALILLFGMVTDRFLTGATFTSIAYQLPELGLLTLAMLIPLISGGLNLSITFSANISGLVLAWVLMWGGGENASVLMLCLAIVAAIASGAIIGWLLGVVVAYTGAHPILASLAMMIFLRGLGEFITRGGSITGFPSELVWLGQGELLGVPVPLVIFALCVGLWLWC